VIRSLPWVWRAPLALCAGVVTLPAFAPVSLYPFAVLGPALLFLLLRGLQPGAAFREGWLYGLGLLGPGVFWMHISIDQFGNVGTPLAILITLAFIAAVALFYGVTGWLTIRLSGEGASIRRGLLLFPLIWVLLEWVRGWFLTGFPWLSLGYSQVESPLSGWAPLLGVFGVSLAVLLTTSCLLALFLYPDQRGRVFALVGLASLWGGGSLLMAVDWTRPAGEALQVSIVQGNVPQHLKWKREQLRPTLALYSELTRQYWGSDLIIWPETAVPAFRHQVEEAFLEPLNREALEHESDLLLGIADRPPKGEGYYNAMLSLGDRREIYQKRHLVPFGEFMPLKPLLEPLIDWLQIPMSDFSSGIRRRPLLTLAGYPAGISICYEDAFGEEVIQALPEAAFLVNASNDAWFGDSLALPQHLEIARMRALETGRYLLRATNTGISAIIGIKGELQAVSPAFERHVLSGMVVPMTGMTPYARFGNWLLVELCSLLLFGVLILSRHKR